MQERRFLLITVFLVALVGAPAVYSVVKEPEEMVKHRSPASVLPAPSQIKTAKLETSTRRNAIRSKSVVLEYPCKNSNKVQEVDGTLLRLKGHSCVSEKWKNVSIVNTTNGFTGSVIFLKDQKFTTDFIDLVDGDNQLKVQATDENGRAVSQSFTVKRRQPASEAVQ